MSHKPPTRHDYSAGLWVMPGHLFSMHGQGRAGTILKWVVLAQRIGPLWPSGPARPIGHL